MDEMILDLAPSVGNGMPEAWGEGWGRQGVGGPKLALAIAFQLEGAAGSQQRQPPLTESVQGMSWIFQPLRESRYSPLPQHHRDATRPQPGLHIQQVAPL